MSKFESYKNWINEKFAEDSDPVQDMGIGIETYLTKKLSLVYDRKLSDAFYGKKYRYNDKPHDTYTNCADETYVDLSFYGFKKVDGKLYITAAWSEYEYKDENYYVLYPVDQFLDDEIKESLNEKFTEDGDPIKDMGIGIEHAIKKFIDDAMKGSPYSILTNVYEQISYCVQKGKVEFVDYLIKKLSATPDNYLATAVIYNQLEIIKLLIEKYKADPNLRNAVFYIIRYRRIEMLKYFLENGLDPRLSLVDASKIGTREIIELFINYGVDVTISDNLALTTAAKAGNLETMKVLIYHGAKVSDELARKIPGWEYSNKRVRVRNLLKKYKLI